MTGHPLIFGENVYFLVIITVCHYWVTLHLISHGLIASDWLHKQQQFQCALSVVNGVAVLNRVHITMIHFILQHSLLVEAVTTAVHMLLVLEPE